MEFVLLALLALAIPVLGIVGFFRTVSLSRRLQEAETRLVAVERQLARGILVPPAATAAPAEEAELGPEPQPTDGEAAAQQPPVQAAGAGAPAQDDGDEPALPGSEPASPGTWGTAPARPAPGRSFEEVVGTRWAVWVGGVALGLGGIFLVRYSIEQGWFGPAARVAMGALFALALFAAGEFTRRRERLAGVVPLPGQAAAHVPSVLTAAGTLSAFATVYAAHALYGMIGSATAFVLLGLVGLGSLALAAIHGPALAAIGLVAAFAAPLLVSSGAPDAWAPVVYVAIVAAAGYTLARVRLWPWLAASAAGGGIAWGILLLLGPGGFQNPTLVHIVLQTALAVIFLAVLPYAGRRDDPGPPDRLALGALAAFGALAVLALASFDDLGGVRPVFAGLMLAMMLLAAWRAAPVALASAFGGVVALAALWTWPVASEASLEGTTMLPGPLALPPMPDAVWLFLLSSVIFGSALAASAFIRLMRGETLPFVASALHAAAGVAGPLLILFVAWLRVEGLSSSVPFALVALGAGAAMAGLARLFARTEPGSAAHLVGLEAFAAGALAALGLGLAIAFERNVLTMAMALAALGGAWVTTRTGLGLLRIGVGVLAVLTAARFATDPSAGVDGVGATPIFNALLWTYGVPALCFWTASRLLGRQGDSRVAGLCEAVSVSLAGLLVAFELRHWFSGGDMFGGVPGHLEVGLDVFVALLASAVLSGLGPGRTSLVLKVAAYAYGGLGAAGALAGLFLFNNPLLDWSGETVLGGAVFNSLLAAYALPAVAAGVLAMRSRETRPPVFVLAAAALSFLLALAWLVLEVRRLFQGPEIGLDRPTSEAELYTYTAVLLVTGLLALAYGVIRRSAPARLASAGLILLAVAKAFLVDMAGLEGPLRALSFIGLGIVLVGIGLAYQRLLFRVRPPAAPSGEDAPAAGTS
jgi:uncharacterized membrane protein